MGVHTVGPVWQGGEHGQPAVFARCHKRSLKLAAENEVRGIALPAIGTGPRPRSGACHTEVATTIPAEPTRQC